MFSPQSLQLPKAAQRKYNHNISCQHLTTLDFGILRPVFTRVLNPNEKISVNPSLLGRVSPMAYPVLGDISIVQRAFFVPYRLLTPVWRDFIRYSDESWETMGMYSKNPPQLPYVQSKDIVDAFLNCCYDSANPPTDSDAYYNYFVGARSYVAAGGSFSGEYDLCVPNYNNSSPQLIIGYNYVKLTPQGKIILSLFQSLGYEFAWVQNKSDMNQQFSLLPLFAYLKVFKDWFTDTRYADELNKLFKTADISCVSGDFGEELIQLAGNGFQISLSELFCVMLDCSYSLLPPDVFNSSSINSGLLNGSTLGDSVQVITPSADVSGQSVTLSENGVFLYESNRLSTLSDFAISALKQFSNFVRRNNLAGQRYVDRILARFGVKPNAALSDRCQFIGATSAPVEISDVTATSAGSATVGDVEVVNSLGDYTGKAYCASFDGHFSYETGSGEAEHGLFIVVACILPKMSYFGQTDPQTTQINVLDFFTPEFDAFGSEALPNKFVRASYDDVKSYNNAQDLGLKPDGVFGFVPRYSMLKTQFDKLTGDFRVRSLRESMRCAHLFREIATPSEASQSLENNLDFEKFGPWLRLNYDRIFLQSSDEYEHFYCRFVFDAKLVSLMRPMYDELMLNDGDDEHNGTISMDINGRRF